MAPALVLTEDLAAERGYVGAGPFVFPGVFPGVWYVGEPVEVTELGFQSVDDALAAAEEAGAPLDQVDVAAGTAPARRDNHALSEDEARAQQREEIADEVAQIRTHADADAAARELGITFPDDPRPKLDEKVAAIEAARVGGVSSGTLSTIAPAGDPNELTPAPGAEDSTPVTGEAGASVLDHDVEGEG